MKIDLDLSRKIVRQALERGADEAEVFAVNSKNMIVEVKKGKLDFRQRSFDSGYAVRILRESRQGLSYSTDPEAWNSCVEIAIESARWSEQDPFFGLPEKNSWPEVSVYDPEIENLSEEDLEEMALLIEKTAFSVDSRITKTRKTSVSISTGESIIVNSHGIVGSIHSTSIGSSITLVAEEHGEAQTGWDFRGSRFLKDIDFAEIGRTASGRALRLLGARKILPMKTPVVLENHISADFLGILASVFSAENIQKGKSLLKGKVDFAVASELIDLIDDPLTAGLVGSRPFDAEGVASQKKLLVKKGLMQGVIHNTYTARKENITSTGNAVRGLGSIPSVGITNFSLLPSEGTDTVSPEALVSRVERGVLVTDAMGIHTANPISGDFSVGISGMLIKEGSVLHPFREAVLSGNVIDLFRNITALGTDFRFYGKIGTPSLLIQDQDISG